jgi:hypothetical protein
MKVVRLSLSLVVAAVILVACQAPKGSSSSLGATSGGNVANAAPGTAPVAGTLTATEVDAAIFHDDIANLDLAQVLAWDDSSHTGVFISVPVAMVSQPGSVAIGATTPGVFGRFGFSHEGHDNDCARQWYFGLYSATLVVTQAASQAGDVIAVSMSNAVFELVDEHGSVNPAVTANLALTNTLSATTEDDAIYEQH